MKNNRSPGPDGFTAEFYKKFWKDISHFWLMSVNEGFEKSMLSTTQKLGIISIIPKEEKCTEYL